jgi:hypothetical protein
VNRLRRIGAVLAALVAAALLVLAVDVLSVWRDVRHDDFRFQNASTRQAGLWQDLGLVPGSLGVSALGLGDDLDYRRTVVLFASVQPGRTPVADARVESLRGQAQLELTRRSQADSDRRRRSRLLNFLGVLPLERAPTDAGERAGLLQTAIGILRTAVEVDPTNAEAKLNLELLLRDIVATGGPVNTPGGQPTGGPRSGVGGVGGAGY